MRTQYASLPARFAPLASAATALRSSREAAAPTFGLRPRLVDVQCTPVQIRTVQRGDRLIRLRRIGHFHEGKAAAPAGVAICNQIDAIYLSVRFEQRSHRRLSSRKIKIADEYVLQFVLFLSLNSAG